MPAVLRIAQAQIGLAGLHAGAKRGRGNNLRTASQCDLALGCVFGKLATQLESRRPQWPLKACLHLVQVQIAQFAFGCIFKSCFKRC